MGVASITETLDRKGKGPRKPGASVKESLALVFAKEINNPEIAMKVYNSIDAQLDKNEDLKEAANQAKRLISHHQVTFTTDETRPGQYRVNFHTIGKKKVRKSVASNPIPSKYIPVDYQYPESKFIDFLKIGMFSHPNKVEQLKKNALHDENEALLDDNALNAICSALEGDDRTKHLTLALLIGFGTHVVTDIAQKKEGAKRNVRFFHPEGSAAGILANEHPGFGARVHITKKLKRAA